MNRAKPSNDKSQNFVHCSTECDKNTYLQFRLSPSSQARQTEMPPKQQGKSALTMSSTRKMKKSSSNPFLSQARKGVMDPDTILSSPGASASNNIPRSYKDGSPVSVTSLLRQVESIVYRGSRASPAHHIPASTPLYDQDGDMGQSNLSSPRLKRSNSWSGREDRTLDGLGDSDNDVEKNSRPQSFKIDRNSNRGTNTPAAKQQQLGRISIASSLSNNSPTGSTNQSQKGVLKKTQNTLGRLVKSTFMLPCGARTTNKEQLNETILLDDSERPPSVVDLPVEMLVTPIQKKSAVVRRRDMLSISEHLPRGANSYEPLKSPVQDEGNNYSVIRRTHSSSSGDIRRLAQITSQQPHENDVWDSQKSQRRRTKTSRRKDRLSQSEHIVSSTSLQTRMDDFMHASDDASWGGLTLSLSPELSVSARNKRKLTSSNAINLDRKIEKGSLMAIEDLILEHEAKEMTRTSHTETVEKSADPPAGIKNHDKKSSLHNSLTDLQLVKRRSKRKVQSREHKESRTMKRSSSLGDINSKSPSSRDGRRASRRPLPSATEHSKQASPSPEPRRMMKGTKHGVEKRLQRASSLRDLSCTNSSSSSSRHQKPSNQSDLMSPSSSSQRRRKPRRTGSSGSTSPMATVDENNKKNGKDRRLQRASSLRGLKSPQRSSSRSTSPMAAVDENSKKNDKDKRLQRASSLRDLKSPQRSSSRPQYQKTNSQSNLMSPSSSSSSQRRRKPSTRSGSSGSPSHMVTIVDEKESLSRRTRDAKSARPEQHRLTPKTRSSSSSKI